MKPRATCTCTGNGESYTATGSPYTFTVGSAGTYTITATDGTATDSETVVITTSGQSESVTLSFIPDGSTVTPTDDIQTWLHCADIWDKNYTTIAQVLADGTTLSALISDDNAVDYMVRSTTWATDVCSNQTAMSYIGLNDYCSDTLLADSTWLNAICNSTYFESVLNVKVPSMTSPSTPSGNVSQSAQYDSSSFAGWRAFDGNGGTSWAVNDASSPQWIQYEFSQPMVIHKVYHYAGYEDGALRCKQYKISGSNDGSSFTDIFTSQIYVNSTSNREKTEIISGITAYKYIRMHVYSYSRYFGMFTIQFYGRASS